MGSESALVEQQAPPQTDVQSNPDLFQFAYPVESQAGTTAGEGAMTAFQSFAPDSQVQSQQLPEGFPQDVQIAGMEGAPAGDPSLQSGPVIESVQDQTQAAAAAPELDPQTEAHQQELETALTQLMSVMNSPESPQTSQQIESDLANVLNASFDIGQSATVAATQGNPSVAGDATGGAPPSEAAMPTEAMAPPSEAAMPAEAMAAPAEAAMPTEPMAAPTEAAMPTEPMAAPTEAAMPTEPMVPPTEAATPTEPMAAPTEAAMPTEPMVPPTEAATPTEPIAPPSETAMPTETMAPPTEAAAPPYETAMAPPEAIPAGEQAVPPEAAAPNNSLNFAPQEQSNGQVDALDANLAATPRTAELQTQLKDAIKDLVTNYPNQNSSEAEKREFTEKILAAAQIAQKIGIIAKAKELGQTVPADF